MSIFTQAADFYEARPGVAPEVVDFIIGQVPIPIETVLDLGAGDGKVADNFTQRLPEVKNLIAVECDEAMFGLAKARLETAAVVRGFGFSAVNATAEAAELPDDESVDLVVACRSFHWMDQERVLRRLDKVVSPLGAVTVLKDLSLWDGIAPWQNAVRSTIQSYLGNERRAGQGIFRQSFSHATAFNGSPFPRVVETALDIERRWQFSEKFLLSWIHSNSFSTPDLFGDKLAQFQDEVCERVELFVDQDGILSEPNRFDVLIASR